MKIVFQFPDKDITLDVKLLDNPAVDSWADHFLSKDITVKSFIQNQMISKHWNPTDLENILNTIRDRISKLSLHGYTYNGAIPDDINQLDQSWANHIHRFFTHTQKSINDSTGPRPINEVLSWLQDVNEYVHQVENYVDKPLKDFNIEPIEEIYLSYEPTPNSPGWWTILPEWRQYHTREHHDVVLGSQILGKTILRSYIDQDDPTDWDTSGHYHNNAALQILPTDRRERLYSSNHFRQWVESHGATLDSVWYDFPIGDVENRDSLDEVYARLNNGKIVDAIYLP